jgi:Fe-S cluster assembly protein SufD
VSARTAQQTVDQTASNSLLALQVRGEAARREGEAIWIAGLREQALAAFAEQGIPTRRLEAWKGTSLAALEAMTFGRAGSDQDGIEYVRPGLSPSTRSRSPRAGRFPGEVGAELVFVDGRFDPVASQIEALPEGCHLLPLAEARRSAPELLEGRLGQLADPKRHALVALQTAFLDDGLVLVVDRNLALPAPIRVRFLTSDPAEATGTTEALAAAPTTSFSRLLVAMGEHSQATLLHEHETLGVTSAAGLSACVGEIHLAAGARLETIQLQSEAAPRIHFTSLHARLERDARLDSHVFTLGPGLTRSELEITLAEPGAGSRMRGFFLGRESGHIDHFTTVDHASHHCTSDQEYRGVLGDRSRGVFRGRAIVRPDAQKTDARQSNPNLLVSDHASIDSKPQLEIYADDVRASHGSTIGQLDPDALFFLRARGIGHAAARLMLTRAFAHGIVDGVEDDDVRAHVAARVDQALTELDRGALRDGITAGSPDEDGTPGVAGIEMGNGGLCK